MITIRVCSPTECSPEMLGAFHEMVMEGGEVLPEGLARRVRRAAFLAFAQEGETLVGVAALKNPHALYRADVFQKAKGRIAADFSYELGWAYVVPTARAQGVSTSLVDALIKRGEAGVYATSRAGNDKMHRTLRRVGFEVSGVPYASQEHPGEEILLFLRPHSEAILSSK